MMSDVDAGPVSDEEAYARHSAELVRFATVLIGPSGADDLVAETAVKVFASSAWRQVNHQRAYLFRAVLNEARQRERSATRRRRRERLAASPERVEAPVVRPEVIEAMRGLQPRQRAIVYFVYWEDREVSDVADHLDISVRTVQRELVAAREHLREALS
jgi:RNA polymerase sigma factor (sigma-70 family)